MTKTQYEQGFSIAAELIWLEEFTYMIEFAYKFGHCDAYDLKTALTSPGLDPSSNYQIFETIGDVVVKFISVLAAHWN